MAKILLVDDEQFLLESLELFLVEKGHEISKAQTGEEGLACFLAEYPEIIILDIRLPDFSGLKVLEEIQKNQPTSKVIMITAFQDMETTVEAMKKGAYDYIHKPLDIDELEKIINRALQVQEVEEKTTSSLSPTDSLSGSHDIIGKSDEMRQIFKMIGLLCQNKASVLIQGETGTGKELVARVIHKKSPFHIEPFVTLDCSSVVETLLESELFGHEKGAFTGATFTKPGKIEQAGKGTLLLDEVGELPLSLQGKFLGFLQRREYMRVGGQQLLRSNCRIIAATNRDLFNLVQDGEFKEDLFYRLRVVNINVPPLRDRITDIPYLVQHILQKINNELGTSVSKLQTGVMDSLMAHQWIGNVRELENVLVEAVIKAQGSVILYEEIENILHRNKTLNTTQLHRGSLPQIEKEHIQKTLAHVNWNRTKAAHLLGISLPTLRNKISKYSLSPE
jgi:two-component system response regulator AtoC